MKPPTAAIMTLGCRLNQADSSLLADRLHQLGFQVVSSDSDVSPDLILVNSCSVTATAFRKSCQTLRSIRNRNPHSFLVLTGCGATTEKESLETCDFADLVVPNEKKTDIPRLLKRHLACLSDVEMLPVPPESDDPAVFFEGAQSFFPFKSRAILKIQEGCENFCSYCIVPYARGPERSRDAAETIADFRTLVDSGFQEIVLSGVNTCNYRAGGMSLPSLLRELIPIAEGKARIRLSSTEPGPILPELLRVMHEAGDAVCRFLHLPLQHGSDPILRAMNRRYMRTEYAEYVEFARQLMPDIHIGSDLIVGFPGETDECFDDSLQFVRSLQFANLHIFPFSPRKGTPAASLNNPIPGALVKPRADVLQKLKQSMHDAFAQSLLGHREAVLCESRNRDGEWIGWSGNYMKTRICSPHNLARKLVPVRFSLFSPEDGILNADELSCES